MENVTAPEFVGKQLTLANNQVTEFERADMINKTVGEPYGTVTRTPTVQEMQHHQNDENVAVGLFIGLALIILTVTVWKAYTNAKRK